MDEEGDIVPRVPNEELNHAFLDKVPEQAVGETDNQRNLKTEQTYPESEQIPAQSQDPRMEKQKGDNEIPRVVKRKHGWPQKTRIVVNRANSIKVIAGIICVEP